MATLKPLYGTAASLTITLASLASSAASAGVGRQSTAIANSTDLAIDSLVWGSLVTGITTANTQMEVWAFASADGGTTYSGGAGGTDAGLTLIPATKSLLRPVTIIPVPDTTGRTYTWGPFSIAQLYGGTMPDHWGIWILNSSGVALSATGNLIKYLPVQYQSV